MVEREGQVDPQPRAQGVRPALTALRGAKITGFKSSSENHYELSYVVRDETRLIRYAVGADGGADFSSNKTVSRDSNRTNVARAAEVANVIAGAVVQPMAPEQSVHLGPRLKKKSNL